VLLPEGAAPEDRELLDMTIFRRRYWPFRAAQPVNALGRVVRVTAPEGGRSVEVGVRFHTPLQKIRRRLQMPWLSIGAANGPHAIPSA